MMASVLECPRCNSEYDLEHHLPKILGCGHTICLVCTADITYINADINIQCIECPECDELHSARDIPTNFKVVDVFQPQVQRPSGIQKYSSRLYQRVKRMVRLLCTPVVYQSGIAIVGLLVVVAALVIPRIGPNASKDINRIKNPLQHYAPFKMTMSFGKRGAGLYELEGPWGVAVSPYDGGVVVTDVGNARVVVRDNTGQVTASFGTSGTGPEKFSNPRGVAVSDNGTIFVADQTNHRIQVYDASGNFLFMFGSYGKLAGQLNGPSGVTFDRQNGSLYVCDTGNARINVYTQQGDFVWSYNDSTSEPLFIAVSRQRVVFSDTDGNIVMITLDGKLVNKSYAGGKKSGFTYARGVAVDSGDNIIVAEKTRLTVLDAVGHFVMHIPGEPLGLVSPRAIAVTEQNIVVIDYPEHVAKVFTPWLL